MPKPRVSKILFFFEKQCTLRERGRLKKYILSVCNREKASVDSIYFIFCSDQRLLEINKKYLHHNYYTDTVTFRLSGNAEPILGEIYISVDRVQENAASFRESFRRELHRVIFHSTLHLCGFNDNSSERKLQMHRLEDMLLKDYLK